MRLLGSRVALLLWLSFFCCPGGAQIMKLSGSDVTFTAAASDDPSEISWLKEGNKLVDVEKGSAPYYYNLHERVIVDLPQKTFTLMKVTPADSGLYKAAALVRGILEDSEFRLQVYDHVCQVVIHNITAENNDTLQCTCSSLGAPPSKYRWYNGSDHLVSEEQNFTVLRKVEETQQFKCMASNELSNNTANFTVPTKVSEHEWRSRLGIPIFIAMLVLVLLVLAILFLRNRCAFLPTQGATDEERQRFNKVNPGEPSTLCGRVYLLLVKETATEILIGKAKKDLMKIVLHSQSLCLDKLSVQRGRLKIMDVEEGDYGTYTAKVQPPIRDRDTFTFSASKLVQNGDAGAHDDRGAKPVYLKDGKLNIQIDNAEKAEKIIWMKNDEKLLTVTCGSDPLMETLALNKGALKMDLISGDKGPYSADVSLPDGNSVAHYKFDINVSDIPGEYPEERETKLDLKRSVTFKPTQGNGAALGFGNVTLCPVNVRVAEKIIWMKDNQTIVEWDATGNPRFPTQIEAFLDPVSCYLTLKNVEEKDNGKYTMQINDDRTTMQTFILTIKLETAF